jgi:hypothetical protein
MQITGPDDHTDQITYDQIKNIRREYAVYFFVLIALTLCAGGLVRALLSSPTSVSPSGSAENPWELALLFGVPRLLFSALTYAYADRLSMRNKWLWAVLSAIPLLTWIAFYAIVGYVPAHLKEQESAENAPLSPFPYWVLPGLIPLLIMGFLFALRPQYMNQLLLGPPLGANIPGIGIPCGWSILIMITFLIAAGDFIAWFAYNRRLVRGAWIWLLTFQIVVIVEAPAIWLILLGPATVQLYKQFLGG